VKRRMLLSIAKMPNLVAFAGLSDMRKGVVSEDLSSSRFMFFTLNDIVDDTVQVSSFCKVGNWDCNDES